MFRLLSLGLTVFGTFCYAVATDVSNVFAQDPPASESVTRERTAVYPLDAVQASDGNLFIVDRNLPGVWKHSNNLNSIFIQGETSFRKPMNAVRCIAVDKSGKIYVGDSATREVYEINANGESKPLAGGRIGVPVDIAVSDQGIIYVADLERRCIWKWSLLDGKPEPLFPKANARGIAIDSKNRLWVLSQNAEQLIRYEPEGPSEVLVSKRTFEFAHNILVDDDDTAWISDGYAKAIWKVTPGQEPIKAISSEQFKNPVGLFKWDDKIGIVDPHAMSVFQSSREGQVELKFKIEKQ